MGALHNKRLERVIWSSAINALEKYSPLLFLLMWSSGAIFVKLGLEDALFPYFSPYAP